MSSCNSRTIHPVNKTLKVRMCPLNCQTLHSERWRGRSEVGALGFVWFGRKTFASVNFVEASSGLVQEYVIGLGPQQTHDKVWVGHRTKKTFKLVIIDALQRGMLSIGGSTRTKTPCLSCVTFVEFAAMQQRRRRSVVSYHAHNVASCIVE